MQTSEIHQSYLTCRCKRQTLKLSSGEDLEADFVFVCVGTEPQSGLTSAVFDLNEKGQVKVDRTDLSVVGQARRFSEEYCVGCKQAFSKF